MYFLLEMMFSHTQVAADSGELGLQEVYNLIEEGENLPVHFEKELKVNKYACCATSTEVVLRANRKLSQ